MRLYKALDLRVKDSRRCLPWQSVTPTPESCQDLTSSLKNLARYNSVTGWFLAGKREYRIHIDVIHVEIIGIGFPDSPLRASKIRFRVGVCQKGGPSPESPIVGRRMQP